MRNVNFPLYNAGAKESISCVSGADPSVTRLIVHTELGGYKNVKKLIVAINGILLLAGLLLFTSMLSPSTASASVMPQNSNGSMMMTSNRHHNRRRHYRRSQRRVRHHRRHMGNTNRQ
jgi:hypothetical protein